MSELEYEYFKIKSRSKTGRVAVDFVKLFEKGDASQDIMLRDSDVINVPRKRRVVNISGEVANPGFLTHLPEKDYIYYIKTAGGFSDRAGRNRISVIKANGEWKKARKGRPLDPGDTIWIPEKKKHNYIGTIKDVAIFVGNLATVYLVVRQATE
jgi:protein involved in polysaccharide export with SLBB domain